MQEVSEHNPSRFAAIKTSNLGLLIRAGIVFAGFAFVVIATSGWISNLNESNRSFVLVPVSLGLAVMVTGVAAGSRWQAAAFWLSLSMLGQTLSLQMINAGYQLRYQHYKPLDELLRFPSTLYVGALLVQAILVGFGLRRQFSSLVNWITTNVRPWQAIILASCFFLPAATLSRDVSAYGVELVLAGLIQLLALATIYLFAAAIPKSSLEELKTLFGRFVGDNEKTAKAFLAIAVLFVVTLSIVLNIYSYERHPHVPDEVAYLLQANLFASGSLTMQAPPVPEAFEVYLVKIDGTTWYPVTPPGWALLLSVGSLVGAPLIVNPILAGLNVLLSFWLVSRLYSRSTAVFVAALLSLSPWFVFLGMSFMTHMSALTCLLIAAAGVVKARETEKLTWAIVAGSSIGFLSLIRPLEAVAVAGLIGLWAVGVGGKRLNLKTLSALVCGTVLIGSLGLAFNAQLTGNALQFPINAYTDEVFGAGSNAYGFGPDRGMGWELDPGPGHGPIDALVNTNLNSSALNVELLGWWIGSFLPIGFLLCFGKLRRSDLLMLAVVVVIYGIHFFYYFSGGPDFGARYWFLMILPLVVLSVRGIASFATKLMEVSPDAEIRVYASAVALTLLALAVFIPWRAVDKYPDFRGMRADVRALANELQFGRSLVLVQGNKHPDYDSAFVYNTEGLSGDGPIYAWDKDAATRAKLLAAYADRPVWIIRGPSLTGSGFELAGGPFSTDALSNSRDQ